MRAWLGMMLVLPLVVGCGGKEEACPEETWLETSDAPCACGEDEIFDPSTEEDLMNYTCECLYGTALNCFANP